MSGSSSRFRRGVVASVLAQLVGIVDNLILIPLFLASWGPRLYGEWLCLFAAVAYVALADMGFSSYVVNRLNQAWARSERRAYLETLHSALAFSLLVSLAVLAVIVAGALTLPLERWFGIEVLADRRSVVCLLGLQVTLSIPRGLVLGVYRSIGEYGRGAMVSNVRRVAALGTTASLLLVGVGPLGVAAGQLAPLVALFAFALTDLRRRHPWLRFGLSHRVPGLARTFLRPSLLFLTVQMSLVLVLQGTTLAAGALFGAVFVPVFAATRTMANVVRQLTGALSNALWPEITTMSARGQTAELHRIHLTFVKSVSALALFAGAALAVCGGELFAVWTRSELEFDQGLLTDFLVLLVLQTPWTASSYLLLATNRHERLARWQLGAALGSLACGVLLASAVGPRGLVWGVILVEACTCSFLVPRAAVRIVGTPFATYVREVYGRGLLVLAIVAAVIHATSPAFEHGSVPAIAARASLAATAVAAATWFLWLGRDERAQLLRLATFRLIPSPLRPHERQS